MGRGIYCIHLKFSKISNGSPAPSCAGFDFVRQNRYNEADMTNYNSQTDRMVTQVPDSNITRRALAAAMKQLMAEQPFAKISVGEICELCDMNRKSFYYHFRDKYDLVNWIFYTEFFEAIQHRSYQNGWQLLEEICIYLYNNKEFYINALMVKGQNSFSDYFKEVITPIVEGFLGDLYESGEDRDFYVTFLTDALLASMIRWLQENAKIQPGHYLRLLRNVIQGTALRMPEPEQAGDAE